MLVLTRKNGESMVVGSPDDVEGPITITVLEIRAGRVRLGLQAADNVAIDRLEVWEKWHPGGQPNCSNNGSTPATAEPMERWEDDGGGADDPTQRPAAVD